MIANAFPPLTILEEFLLLAHDGAAGQFYPIPRSVFDAATAGAILMDLALRHRIDNDLRTLFVVDTVPTEDNLLDPVLQVMALAPVMQPRPFTQWLHQIASEAESLRERSLRRLEARGILKREAKKILWVFTADHYAIPDGSEVREVRQRLRDIFLKDALPLPHDIMLTALAQACGLFQHVFKSPELTAAMPRIEQVARMDLIGQAVTKAVAEIEAAMAIASGFR